MNSKQFRISMIVVLLACVIMTVPGVAQVPKKINYQGYLTDSMTGMPVNSDVAMTFSIYDTATGGTALWAETRTVTISDGHYSVQLGDTTPLDLQEPKPYWLGIQIGADPEMAPREELTSVLYAVFAQYLEGITIKDGKVGIGTDDPQEMLDVHGNAHIRGTLRVGPNSMMIGPIRVGTGQHYIYTTEGEAISFTNPNTGTPTNLTEIGNVDAKGSITSEGNITATGTISAGAISTTEIVVDGQIKGNKLCIGNDCRNSWPVSCNSCLPNCANGQTVKYNGSAAKWECDGEPVPIVTTKPLYRWLNYGSDRAGDWTDYMDSQSSTPPFPAFDDGRCTLGEILTVQVAGTKPLYAKSRTHNGSGLDVKDDHLTTDNRDDLNSEGWTNYEGILGYVYTSQVSGTVPLYRKYQNYSYNSKPARDYMSTLNKNETGPITGDGWVYEKILGYIIAPSSESCQ